MQQLTRPTCSSLTIFIFEALHRLDTDAETVILLSESPFAYVPGENRGPKSNSAPAPSTPDSAAEPYPRSAFSDLPERELLPEGGPLPEGEPLPDVSSLHIIYFTCFTCLN